MALDESSTYVRLEFDDIELGVPLPAPLYDGNRRVLLKRGESIDTTHELENFIERGLYRNNNERHSPLNDMIAVMPSVPVRERRISASASQAASPPEPAAAASRDTVTMLEDSKLRVGDSLFMQSSPEAPRLMSKVIGYLKNKGLIVSVPESESELVMLRDGQSFIVRFFSGQNAYAFTTVVVKQTSVPYPHVHLSYPKEVRGREIRKGSRVDVDLIASIATQTDGTHANSGKVVNLSIGGGALRSKTRLGEKDQVINIKFKLVIGGVPSYIALNCLIRAISKDVADASGMPFLYGLQFLNPEPAMALALTAFVYQKIVGEA